MVTLIRRPVLLGQEPTEANAAGGRNDATGRIATAAILGAFLIPGPLVASLASHRYGRGWGTAAGVAATGVASIALAFLFAANR